MYCQGQYLSVTISSNEFIFVFFCTQTKIMNMGQYLWTASTIRKHPCCSNPRLYDSSTWKCVRTNQKLVRKCETSLTLTRYFSHLSADTDLPIFLSNLTWRSTRSFGTEEQLETYCDYCSTNMFWKHGSIQASVRRRWDLKWNDNVKLILLQFNAETNDGLLR